MSPFLCVRQRTTTSHPPKPAAALISRPAQQAAAASQAGTILRPEQKDLFGSGEFIIEAIVAVAAFYLFLVHTFTAEKPFVRPSLFRDRNFAAGVLFISVIGLTYYSSMALH